MLVTKAIQHNNYVLAEKVNFDEIHGGGPVMPTPAVELSVLASYESLQLNGGPDLIVELIDLYHEDALRRMAVMRESLAKKNWSSVRREAHSLRGSSGNLGALQVASLCARIEEIDSEDLLPNIEHLVNTVEQELERALGIFLAERERRLQ